MLLEIILLVSLTFPGHLRQSFGLIVDLLKLLSFASPAFLICALNVLSFAIVPQIKELILLSDSIYTPLIQPVYLFCSSTLSPYANLVPSVWLSSAFRSSFDYSASMFSSASFISTQLIDCLAAKITSSTRTVSSS